MMGDVWYCDRMKTSLHHMHSFLRVRAELCKGVVMCECIIVNILGQRETSLRSFGTSAKLASTVSVLCVMW